MGSGDKNELAFEMQESAKECERIETASHCKRNSLDIHTPDFM